MDRVKDNSRLPEGWKRDGDIMNDNANLSISMENEGSNNLEYNNRKEMIELEVYSDEITRVKLSVDGSVWMYLGVIFVPIEFKSLSLGILNNLRCLKHNDWSDESKCPHRCGYHDKNNTEIHYQELHRSNARFNIAKRWITSFVKDEGCKRDRKLIYLNILGLNLSNMNLELFGEDPNLKLKIYNRFYRTVLKAGISYFFKDYKSVVIKKYIMTREVRNHMVHFHGIQLRKLA